MSTNKPESPIEADGRLNVDELARLVSEAKEGKKEKPRRRQLDVAAFVILGSLLLLIIVGVVLILQPVRHAAPPPLLIRLPNVRLSDSTGTAGSQQSVGQLAPSAQQLSAEQETIYKGKIGSGGGESKESDSSESAQSSSSNVDDTPDELAKAQNAESKLPVDDAARDKHPSNDVDNESGGPSDSSPENRPHSQATNARQNQLAALRPPAFTAASQRSTSNAPISARLQVTKPAELASSTPGGSQRANSASAALPPAMKRMPPVTSSTSSQDRLMPGPNPHKFVLLRLPLERRGWTVLWHDGVGAECWKPGNRHAYMWIRPGLPYVKLNGERVAIDLAAVEEDHLLYGDSKIVDIADAHIGR